MYQAVQSCTHCGANLSLDDMRRTDCPYCKTVYPHHSMAAQHAQVASQMMGQMMQQQAAIQDQWRGAYGVPPMNGGPPGGAPPGNPYANAYGDPMMIANAQMVHVNAMQRSIHKIVIGVVLSVFVVVALGIALVVLL